MYRPALILAAGWPPLLRENSLVSHSGRTCREPKWTATFYRPTVSPFYFPRARTPTWGPATADGDTCSPGSPRVWEETGTHAMGASGGCFG